ncbi:MAG: hypothetical protein II467_04540, partial [Bacilli bacterium]|nr:hypothetical protein [Bacilli bacterium]
MLSKKGIVYRLVTITLAFLVLGMAAFLPLFASNVVESNRTALIVASIVFGALYLIVLIGNEIFIAIKK